MSVFEKQARNQEMRQLLGITNKELLIKYQKIKESVLKLVGDKYNQIKIVEMPSGMRIKSQPPALYLEKALIKNALIELVEIIVLHELYHQNTQNLTIDMKHIKHIVDYFGSQTMHELDIDADIEAFAVLQKNKNLSFKKFLEIIHNASTFASDKIRLGKFSRFVGGILGAKIWDKYGVKIIAFPYLNETITETVVPFCCIAGGRKLATAEIINLDLLKKLHREAKSFEQQDYVEKLNTEVEKIANQIYSQLTKNMFQNNLKQALANYPFDDGQNAKKLLTKQLNENQNLRDRKNFEAHLSTKAFVFSPNFTQVLLLDHKTLGRWLQPGGHIDETDNSLWKAGEREAMEEAGFANLTYHPLLPNSPETPTELDTHTIPKSDKKQEPEHIHYGFSYIFTANLNELKLNLDESSAYKWISFEDFAQMSEFETVAQKVKNNFIN